MPRAVAWPLEDGVSICLVLGVWFNPVDNLGFGYSVTGAVQGLTGDQNRTDPILLAVMEAVRAGDGSAAPKL